MRFATSVLVKNVDGSLEHALGVVEAGSHAEAVGAVYLNVLYSYPSEDGYTSPDIIAIPLEQLATTEVQPIGGENTATPAGAPSA